MYVHAIAFVLPMSSSGSAIASPGPKWNFRMAIRYTAERDDQIFCEPLDTPDDYFTKAAAEQAALHYGKFAIDLIRG